MSADALQAFHSIAGTVPAALARLELGRYRRPTAAALLVVGQRLAWQLNGRGYVDETAGQIVAATGLTPDQVERCMPVLEALGLWTAITRGGSRAKIGSKRIPGPALCAAAAELGLSLETELTAPVRPVSSELTAPVRPVSSEGAGTHRTGAVRNPGTHRTGAEPLNRKQQIHKDDDDRAITHTAPDPPPSSSSSGAFSLIRKASQREAGSPNATKLIRGIERNWRDERDADGYSRFDKAATWKAAGYDDARIIELVVADAPIETPATEAPPPPPPVLRAVPPPPPIAYPTPARVGQILAATAGERYAK